MENITDALKMAAFTLLFVGALTIAIMTFSQVRATSQAILYNKDEKNNYSYIEKNNTTRIVGISDIIPTIYRYYIENYRIEFYYKNNQPIELYTVQSKEWNDKNDDSLHTKYEKNSILSIYYLDLDDENKRSQPVALKNSDGNIDTTSKYWNNKKLFADWIVNNVIIKKYSNSIFKEEVCEIDDKNPNTVNKRVIKYILQ